MKRHKTFQWQTYMLVFLFGITFCCIGGCQGGKQKNETEAPPPPPPKPKVEPRYEKGTVLLIMSGEYSYLARVTADTLPSATKVPIRLFNENIRNTIGDTVTLEEVTTPREKPPEGWGTRKVALEYFDGNSWTYTMDALEAEDYYTLTDENSGVHRLEFANVRFPRPIRLDVGHTK